MPLPVQVADIGGGGLAPAVAILGALVGVERGGDGGHLDIAMTDAAAGWLALAFAAHAAGEAVGRGDQRLAGRYPCYRVYACKDGGHYSVAALEPKFWTALCGALGRPDLVEQQYSEDPRTQTTVASIFPVKHLSHAIIVAYNPLINGTGFHWQDLEIMGAWGVAALTMTLRRFRWEPREQN